MVLRTLAGGCEGETPDEWAQSRIQPVDRALGVRANAGPARHHPRKLPHTDCRWVAEMRRPWRMPLQRHFPLSAAGWRGESRIQEEHRTGGRRNTLTTSRPV
jgi:hypothetical protein